MPISLYNVKHSPTTHQLILLQGIVPRQPKTYGHIKMYGEYSQQLDSHAHPFTTALLWKQPKRIATGNHINKMQWSSTGEYYSAVKRNEPPINTMTQVNRTLRMLSERSQMQDIYCLISLLGNSRKCKWINSDRKQTSGFLGPGQAGLQSVMSCKKNVKKSSQGDGNVSSLQWWFHGYVHLSKLIKLYILNGCSLLYINYTSTKLIKPNQAREQKARVKCLIFFL